MKAVIWKNSRCILAILLIITSLLLVACASSTPSVEGTYHLTKFMVDGWNIADSYPGSSIFIKGVDDNSSSSITIKSSDSSGTVYGHVSLELESNSMVKYKFWVDMNTGSFFTDEMKYIFLYYYPDKETIEVNANAGITLTFQKDSK